MWKYLVIFCLCFLRVNGGYAYADHIAYALNIHRCRSLSYEYSRIRYPSAPSSFAFLDSSTPDPLRLPATFIIFIIDNINLEILVWNWSTWFQSNNLALKSLHSLQLWFFFCFLFFVAKRKLIVLSVQSRVIFLFVNDEWTLIREPSIMLNSGFIS